MISGILGLSNDEPDTREIEEYRSGETAIEVNRTEYLDGHVAYHGAACGYVKKDSKEIVLSGGTNDTDEGVTVQTTPSKNEEYAYTKYVADLSEDPAFVAIDRGDGEFLWSGLLPQVGTSFSRAHIRLADWYDDYVDRDESKVWADGWSGDHPDEPEPASIQFHDDARAGETPSGMSSRRLVGFQYPWDGYMVRGVITQSGYVAVYSSSSPALFVRWLRDEVLDYATTPKQEVFDE
jgi:hypothetical protein